MSGIVDGGTYVGNPAGEISCCMNVLILSSQHDAHVLRVSEVLSSLGVEVQTLAHDAPEDFAIIRGSEGELVFRIGGTHLAPDLVWMRPKIRPQSGSTLEEHAEEQVNRAQWLGSYREIAACLEDKIYNNHRDSFLDYKKIFQMKVARRCGFKVPISMISNARNELIDFVLKRESAVTKPIGAASLMKLGRNGRLLFQAMLTTRVNRDLAAQCDEESFRFCPALVQEEIKKSFELRIYADHSRVFAISLQSQNHACTEVDWRPGESFISKDIFRPSPGFEARILRLVREIGVAYGVIDIIVDNENKLWFLECNPEGQWASIDSMHQGALAAHIARDMVHRIEAVRAPNSAPTPEGALR